MNNPNGLIKSMEVRLDEIVSEALRRKSREMDLAGANPVKRAAVMAKTRAELKRWRDAAPAAVLMSAVENAA